MRKITSIVLFGSLLAARSAHANCARRVGHADDACVDFEILPSTSSLRASVRVDQRRNLIPLDDQITVRIQDDDLRRVWSIAVATPAPETGQPRQQDAAATVTGESGTTRSQRETCVANGSNCAGAFPGPVAAECTTAVEQQVQAIARLFALHREQVALQAQRFATGGERAALDLLLAYRNGLLLALPGSDAQAADESAVVEGARAALPAACHGTDGARGDVLAVSTLVFREAYARHRQSVQRHALDYQRLIAVGEAASRSTATPHYVRPRDGFSQIQISACASVPTFTLLPRAQPGATAPAGAGGAPLQWADVTDASQVMVTWTNSCVEQTALMNIAVTDSRFTIVPGLLFPIYFGEATRLYDAGSNTIGTEALGIFASPQPATLIDIRLTNHDRYNGGVFLGGSIGSRAGRLWMVGGSFSLFRRVMFGAGIVIDAEGDMRRTTSATGVSFENATESFPRVGVAFTVGLSLDLARALGLGTTGAVQTTTTPTPN